MSKPFTPPQMILSDEDTVLMGIERQEYVKIVPSQGSSGYTPSGTRIIEFTFSHGDSTDWSQSYLEFDLALSAGANFTIASDWCSKVILYVDSAEITQSVGIETRKAINLMLLADANGDWFRREGSFLGFNLPCITAPNTTAGAEATPITTAPHSGSRKYCVPMFLFHLAFAQSRVFPVLGSEVRIQLHLAPALDCLNVVADANGTYTLNNVALMECRQILSDSYRSALKEKMNSSSGYKIRFIDLDVVGHAVNPATTQYLTVKNTHRNSKTLMCYLGHVARTNIAAHANATHIQFWTPLANRTTAFKVNCGSNHFTGLDGSTDVCTHFQHLERASGTASNLSQSGLYDWPLYTGNGVGNGTRSMPAGWAVSPLVCSLEKIQLPDTDTSITQNGLSGFDEGMSRDINVTINTSEALDNATERMFSCLVYEKTVIMADNRIIVEA